MLIVCKEIKSYSFKDKITYELFTYKSWFLKT